MSYIIVRVYSFECDAGGGEETIEAQTAGVAEAEREIRAQGWQVTVRRLQHFCPAHHRKQVTQ